MYPFSFPAHTLTLPTPLLEHCSATPNLTPRTKLRKQVALEGWLEATKEGFAQLYATVFVDGGYDDPQGTNGHTCC